MNFLLSTFWFVFELKFILFWLYLWQLKEYHIGRFLDHFSTHKGKRALFGFSQILKLILLVFLFFDKSLNSLIFFVLFLVYFTEVLVFLRAIILKTFKKPVITFKSVFLILVSFGVLILFLTYFPEIYEIILFDILTPLIVSFIVLIFQPFFVALRNQTIKKAAIKIQAIKNDYKKLKVIAITGSYGKTSTKEFLTAILSKRFKVLSTKEHQNSEIGIANCVLKDLDKKHQIFIAEVGAYNKGKIKEVCNFLKPKFGIVTGVNEQHLSLFGSMENLLLAEGGGELAECLPDDGILFLNGDNRYCLELFKKTNKNKKLYSLNNKKINADIFAEEVSVFQNHLSFLAIDAEKETAHFKVNVLGKQNVQNLLAAILVAKQLGMNFSEIVEGCKNIKPEQAGMVLKQGKHGIDVIDSSYSANPDGVFADLDYLKIYKNKKLIVMPCLIELGKESDKIHKKIGRKIGEVCDLAIITSKDKFVEIKRGAMETGMQEKNIIFCGIAEDIYSAITTFCKSGDAVLLEGRVPQKLHELL